MSAAGKALLYWSVVVVSGVVCLTALGIDLWGHLNGVEVARSLHWIEGVTGVVFLAMAGFGDELASFVKQIATAAGPLIDRLRGKGGGDATP
ncbi:MAG TPA: hypothetical protein VFZ21_29520 [Gemmatimonadaceae bacterium]|nr:hypothetical protein [Gemmatimonadaceae bacterium]